MRTGVVGVANGDIRDDETAVVSGAIDGTLLNQFSLSEHDGHLRIATTLEERQISGISVLKVGDKLVQTGRVNGLGKNENIQSVRYDGNRAYVVTFREIDPLYVLDLSDPENPKELSELKALGFSEYLHVLSGGRLLGIGTNATNRGIVTGAKISLFDVKGPREPVRDCNPTHRRRLHPHRIGPQGIPILGKDWTAGAPVGGQLAG